MYRVRGHLNAHLDPLYVGAAAGAPRARPRHLRADHLGPAADVRRPTAWPAGARRPSRRSSSILRDAYCRTPGHRVRPHHGPRAEALDPAARRGRRARRATLEEQRSHPRARSTRPRSSSASCTRATWARSASASRAPSRRSWRCDAVLDAAADDGAARGGHRHGAPRPAQRAGQRRGQVLQRHLQRVRGQPRPRERPGQRRREVPQGRARESTRTRAARPSTCRWRRTRSHLEAVDPGRRGDRAGQAGRSRAPGRRAPTRTRAAAAYPDPRRC